MKNSDNTEKHFGAVCYIDLLGFSYLTKLLDSLDFIEKTDSTKNNILDKKVRDLSISDYRDLISFSNIFDESEDDEDIFEKKSDYAFCIIDSRLKKFHEVIDEQCNKFVVEWSVISDSVFLFCENTDNLLFATSNIFRESIKNGILLRAGLCSGLYYKVETSLGAKNVYGPAVTKAVENESKGKGCRIFTDDITPSKTEKICRQNPYIFYPYSDYKNFEKLDVFEWLLLKGDYVFSSYDFSCLKECVLKIKDKLSQNSDVDSLLQITFKNYEEKRVWDLITDNILIYSILSYSDLFDWNKESNEGKKQLQASLLYIKEILENLNDLRNRECQNDFLSYDDLVNKNSNAKTKMEICIKQKKLEVLFSIFDSTK